MNQRAKEEEVLDYRKFTSRYRFTGTLMAETALHVGSGRIETTTDSPILRNAAGDPFIPGSSLKGAVRAAVARIAPAVGLKACDPFGDDDCCCSPQNSDKNEHYQAVRRYLGRDLLPGRENDDEAQAAYAALKAFGHEDWIGDEITEDNLIRLLDENLCAICRVFGSPFYASKARFDDLQIETNFQVTEIRDGVGIDRDSERAIPGIKYDFEVVPAGTTFSFGLTVENPSDLDLGLIAIGLRELQAGRIRLGGIRSRGLGRCTLDNINVTHLDPTDMDALKAYVKGEDSGGDEEEAETVLDDAIDALFEQIQGDDNAEATG